MKLRNIFILFFLCVILSAGYFLYTKGLSVSNPALDTIADCFVKEDAGGRSDDCVRPRIQKLLEHHTTREIMSYLVATSTPENIINNCHVVAHILGQETFRQNTSLEDTLAQCTSACVDGCVHGAVAGAVAHELGQEYLDKDIVHAGAKEIEQKGKEYCEKSDALCHGMGHILFIATNDIPRALSACDTIAPMGSSDPCYRGVFMEYGTEETFVEHAIPIDALNNDYSFPCGTVEQPYVHACMVRLPAIQERLFEENNVRQEERFSISKRVCESFSQKARSDCFIGMGRFLRSYVYNIPNVSFETRCESLDTVTDQLSCVAGVALDLGRTSDYQGGLAYCGGITEQSQKTLCYNVVFQTKEISTGNNTTDSLNEICSFSSARDECTALLQNFVETKGTLPRYLEEGLGTTD